MGKRGEIYIWEKGEKLCLTVPTCPPTRNLKFKVFSLLAAAKGEEEEEEIAAFSILFSLLFLPSLLQLCNEWGRGGGGVERRREEAYMQNSLCGSLVTWGGEKEEDQGSGKT